ncbi:MAG: type I restriction enzyme HsdR N-terminal domain-containing protein [Bacteroidales bacterium]|nr:type I restriction enzyme HsdR N-terminal domain-containing protein [Bacteroidales bacterium]
MEPLNLPTYSFSIKEDGDKKYIFDEIRRRYVSLSPEEWVRQHIIKFLSVEKHFPRALMSIEKGFRRNRVGQRYDLLIYDRSGEPVMIVECKAPVVEIAQRTFDQATRYNEMYGARYLLITNGRKHYCCKIDMTTKSYEFLRDIPEYGELS